MMSRSMRGHFNSPPRKITSAPEEMMMIRHKFNVQSFVLGLLHLHFLQHAHCCCNATLRQDLFAIAEMGDKKQ